MQPIQVGILWVDDTPEDVVLAARALKAGGIDPRYDLVDNAKDMRQALRSGQYQVIIMDHVMPMFSAPEAYGVLMDMHITLPAIIYSGRISDSVSSVMLEVGVVAIVTKSTPEALVGAVERALAKTRRR